MLPSDRAATAQRIAQLHAIDHLLRLRIRLDDLLRAGIDLTSPRYAWALSHNQTILELAERGLRELRLTDMLPELQVNAVGLTELSRQMRHELLDGSDDHDSSDAANVLLNRRLPLAGAHQATCGASATTWRWGARPQARWQGRPWCPQPSAPAGEAAQRLQGLLGGGGRAGTRVVRTTSPVMGCK